MFFEQQPGAFDTPPDSHVIRDTKARPKVKGGHEKGTTEYDVFVK